MTPALSAHRDIDLALMYSIQMHALNRLQFYRPGKGQTQFHKSQARKRLLRLPNQTGKTHSGGVEMWWHMTGTHPHRVCRSVPSHGLIMIADIENQYKKFCKKLHLTAPQHLFHSSMKYDDMKGYTYRGVRGIVLNNGSTASFVGGKGEITAVASDTVDWGWIDEPPMQGHWGEFMQRLAAKQAPLWVTLTPVGRPVAWLRESVEADEEWEQIVVPLSVENCPWRTQASIDQQINDTLLWERPQRIYGEWEGLSQNRRIDAFCDENICDVVPEGNYRIVLGMDHGELAGHQIAVVLFITRGIKPTFYVVAEYASNKKTTIKEDVIGIESALARVGVSLLHVDEARGDHNTAGKSEAGIGINLLLEKEFAERAELPGKIAPFPVYPATKGPGSVEYGSKILNLLLREKRLFVHSSCKQLIDSFKYWDGTKNTEIFKHFVDGLRYGVVDELTRAEGPHNLRVAI